MGGPDAAAFIVLVVMLASVIKGFFRWHAGRRPAGPDADTVAQLHKLEDRVKALEAVVTDNSYQLKEKFRELEKH